MTDTRDMALSQKRPQKEYSIIARSKGWEDFYYHYCYINRICCSSRDKPQRLITLPAMILLQALSAVLLFTACLVARECPPVTESFILEQYSLYPESADYDPMTCKLFLR